MLNLWPYWFCASPITFCNRARLFFLGNTKTPQSLTSRSSRHRFVASILRCDMLRQIAATNRCGLTQVLGVPFGICFAPKFGSGFIVVAAKCKSWLCPACAPNLAAETSSGSRARKLTSGGHDGEKKVSFSKSQSRIKIKIKGWL